MKFNKKLTVLAVTSALALSAYTSNAFAYDDEDYADLGIVGEVGYMLETLDTDDSLYQVISISGNDASIDASINLIANEIEFEQAGSANASATALATATSSDVENSSSAAIAQALANSGNNFKTVAVGALNNSDITLLTEFTYDRENNGNEFFVDGYDSGFIGEFGSVAALANAVTGLGGVAVASQALNSEDPRISVFQAAFNTGDINASVNMAAVSLDEVGYYSRSFRDDTDLEIADLAISTTAIGASNSGAISITDSINVIVKTNSNKDVVSLNNLNP
jgi:hypothetical protein